MLTSRNNEFENELLAVLDRISSLLSALLQMHISPAQPERYALTGEQKKVYLLCDATHTIREISNLVGKPANQIRRTLTRLKDKGLIAKFNLGKNVFYYRIIPQESPNS